MNCWIILLLLCRMNGQGGCACGNGGLMSTCQGGRRSEGVSGINAIPEPPCGMDAMPVANCSMNGNAADGCGCGENPGINRNFPSF